MGKIMPTQTYRLSVEVMADKAKQNLDKLSHGINNLEKETKETSKSMDEMDKRSQSLGRTFGMLKGAIGALGLGLTLGSIIRTADSMQTLNNKLKLATGSTEKFGVAMQNIERIAMENKVSLQSVGEMYVSNERSLKQMGKTQQEVIRFTENVTKAMAVGGGSAEAQAAALTQLGQAMASGVLRGDEFNSIAEQAPMIMTLMSESLNVTTGELRKMAAEGKLTNEVVYKALTNAEASEKLKSMSGATATTVSQAMQQVSNQWELAVNKIMNGEGGISQSLAGIISGFAGVIPKVLEFGEAFAQSEAGKAIIEGLGTAFETLKGAVSGIGEFLTPIGDFLSQNEELTVAMASGLAAVAGAIGLVSAVSAIATGVVGAFGAVMAFITSPITIAAVAIGALVAAGVYLYRNWDELSAKAKEIWASIKNTFTTKVDEIKTAVIGKFYEIKGRIATIIGGFPEPVRTALNLVYNAFKTSFTVIKTVVQTSFAFVNNIFTTAFNVIKALVRGDMDGVKKAIGDGMDKAWQLVKTGVENIKSAFSGLKDKLIQAGKDAIQGLIDGIGSKFKAVQEKISEIANYIPSGVRNLLDIRSPSRVMREIGAWAGEGFVLGIGDKVKDAKQVAQDLANALANTVTDLHHQNFMLKNTANPLADLDYKLQFGELADLTDKQKNRLRELANLNLDIQKANEATAKAMQEQQQAAERIASANERSKSSFESLQKQIALFGNTSKTAEFDYDWQNGAFGGVDNMLLLRERSAIAELERLQHQDKTKTAFNQMQGGLAGELSPLAKLQKELDDRLQIIKDFESAHTGVELEAQQAREQAEQAYLKAKTNLMLDSYGNLFNGISGLTKSFFGEQSGIYRAMFAMEKGFAIAKAIIALKANIAEASKIGFPQNIPMIAGAVSQGMGIVNDIRSIAMPVGQAHDGIMSVPKSGTWNLEKGERVLPRHTAKALDNRLDNMGGGQVINVNVTVNSDGSSDVQSNAALGKRFGEAIKAAVQKELHNERRQGGLFYGA